MSLPIATITFRLNLDDANKFVKWCEGREQSTSDALREMVHDIVKGEPDVPPCQSAFHEEDV